MSPFKSMANCSPQNKACISQSSIRIVTSPSVTILNLFDKNRILQLYIVPGMLQYVITMLTVTII